MSNLIMTIADELTVWVDFDYQPAERGDQETPPLQEGVTINAVCDEYYINIMEDLDQGTMETIEQNIFDSFDKELQEPDYEYVEG
jgi:hypothetical protein